MTISVGSRFGNYEIEELIARGGMGVVYRARHRQLSRIVALKVIAANLAYDDSFRQRFMREQRLAASIDHPNVIPLYEAGEEEGVLYIAMRWVAGTDLKALIASEGRLPPARATKLGVQAARAAEAAHDNNLIHRDIKPGNILIARDDHVYLADFGLTKHATSVGGLTRTGMMVGTVDYVAPEQIQGADITPRADIYSLGCVLFEVLTGRVPFERETDLAKVWAHMNAPQPSILEVVPDLPIELDRVVRKAMARDPSERFASMSEFGPALVAASDYPSDLATGTREAAQRAPQDHVTRVSPPPSVTVPGREYRDEPSELREEEPSQHEPPTTRRPGRGKKYLVPIAVALVLGLVAAVGILVSSSGDGNHLKTISVGKSPADVTVGNGTVWVANQGSNTVARIDPATNRSLGKPISVDKSPYRIAISADAVWVASALKRTVSRISVPSNKLAVKPISTETDPFGLAAGQEAVWVANGLEDTVTKIDARKNVVAGTIPVGKEPADLALGNGVLWVVNAKSGTVTRLREHDGKAIGSPIPVGRSPDNIALGEGAAWVVSSGTGTVTRIDALTGEVTKKPIHIGPSAGPIAAGAGAVWVARTSEGTVTRIDPGKNKVAGSSIKIGKSAGRMTIGEGALWVTDPLSNTVVRVDF